jgi:CheY-like chemotaxis protein
LRLLLVDDNHEIAEVVSFYCSTKNIDCRAIEDGQEGLVRIRKDKFDLILLDIAMPDFTGMDIIKSIKQEGSLESINLVVFTASSNQRMLNGLIFVLEFKTNDLMYRVSDIDQCLDYALDLKYFHEESHDAQIIPILIATGADSVTNNVDRNEDGVFTPLKCNKNNLNKTILSLSQEFGGSDVDLIIWQNSIYKPTPTIIEAAQALYQGHNVREISRSDSGADNLTKTADAINKIIERKNKINLFHFWSSRSR